MNLFYCYCVAILCSVANAILMHVKVFGLKSAQLHNAEELWLRVAHVSILSKKIFPTLVLAISSQKCKQTNVNT